MKLFFLNVFYLLPTDWCKARGLTEDFEVLPAPELAANLRQFYAEARKQDGQTYSKNALCGLRSSIQRHLTSPPYNRIINIMNDSEFKRANNMLIAVLKSQKTKQMDKTKHHDVIEEEDLKKLMQSGVLNTNTPDGLQKLVWFCIQYHFCRRGGEGIRELRKDSFEFKVDARGVEYVQLKFNEATKNHPGGVVNTNEPTKRMYATGEDLCPVGALAKYLRKLHPKCEALYQRPRLVKNPEAEALWYANIPVGINKLRNLMKDISKEAKLSKIYTNHCIRATVITTLSNSGFDNITITRLSGHRNPTSITSYCRDASDAQKVDMSSTLSSTLAVSSRPPAASLMPPATATRPSALVSHPPSIQPPLSSSSVSRRPRPLAPAFGTSHQVQAPFQTPAALPLPPPPASLPTTSNTDTVNGRVDIAALGLQVQAQQPRSLSDVAITTTAAQVGSLVHAPTLDLTTNATNHHGLFTNCNIGNINVYMVQPK